MAKQVPALLVSLAMGRKLSDHSKDRRILETGGFVSELSSESASLASPMIHKPPNT